MIPQEIGIEDFVRLHYRAFGSATAAIFATGVAVGRLMFDRAILAIRADSESYKNARDEARRDLAACEGKVKSYKTNESAPIQAEKERSRIKAVGRFFSAIATILLLALVGYGNYLQNRTSQGLTGFIKANSEFQSETQRSLRSLQEKGTNNTDPHQKVVKKATSPSKHPKAAPTS